MRIQIVTPPARGSQSGNRITARRWAKVLRQSGHRVEIGDRRARPSGSNDPDLLIALHARRSFDEIARFHEDHPGRPLVVGLTGTDLYRDLRRSASARRALEWADRLVLLQPQGIDELEAHLRPKARVIHQSARRTRAAVRKSVRTLDVCVVGHLRPVKDPFRTAYAARSLPASSQLRVLHVGRALSDGMRSRAEREMARNARYRWLGERPRWQVLQLLARSHATVNSSLLEGGANAVSEALVAGTAVLASRVPGTVGMLGDDHPGYFEPRKTAELTTLLSRCESEPTFLEELEKRSRRLAGSYTPAREAAAWRKLLAELRSGHRKAS